MGVISGLLLRMASLLIGWRWRHLMSFLRNHLWLVESRVHGTGPSLVGRIFDLLCNDWMISFACWPALWVCYHGLPTLFLEHQWCDFVVSLCLFTQGCSSRSFLSPIEQIHICLLWALLIYFMLFRSVSTFLLNVCGVCSVHSFLNQSTDYFFAWCAFLWGTLVFSFLENINHFQTYFLYIATLAFPLEYAFQERFKIEKVRLTFLSERIAFFLMQSIFALMKTIHMS